MRLVSLAIIFLGGTILVGADIGRGGEAVSAIIMLVSGVLFCIEYLVSVIIAIKDRRQKKRDAKLDPKKA